MVTSGHKVGRQTSGNNLCRFVSTFSQNSVHPSSTCQLEKSRVLSIRFTLGQRSSKKLHTIEKIQLAAFSRCIVFYTVWQEIFVTNLISSLSSEQFFDEIEFLTNFFHKTRVVGWGAFMNVTINGKQKSDDRTTGEQRVTTDVWRKQIPGELPEGRFWRNFFADENFLLYSSALFHNFPWINEQQSKARGLQIGLKPVQ